MATTYKAKGKIFLTKSQFDARKKADTLEQGTEYHIIDSDDTPYATEQYVNNLIQNAILDSWEVEV